jgi:hypothetical protein
MVFAMRYKLDIAQQDDLVSGGARNQMPGILARRVVHRTFRLEPSRVQLHFL